MGPGNFNSRNEPKKPLAYIVMHKRFADVRTESFFCIALAGKFRALQATVANLKNRDILISNAVACSFLSKMTGQRSWYRTSHRNNLGSLCLIRARDRYFSWDLFFALLSFDAVGALSSNGFSTFMDFANSSCFLMRAISTDIVSSVSSNISINVEPHVQFRNASIMTVVSSSTKGLSPLSCSLISDVSVKYCSAVSKIRPQFLHFLGNEVSSRARNPVCHISSQSSLSLTILCSAMQFDL